MRKEMDQMSTWLNDIRRKNPALANAYAIAGIQPVWALRAMVKALSMHAWLNTPEDNARLSAARFIIRNVKKG
jgi:hypothetical protein